MDPISETSITSTSSANCAGSAACQQSRTVASGNRRVSHAFSKTTAMRSRLDRFSTYGKSVGERLDAPHQDFVLNQDGLMIYISRWESVTPENVKGVVIIVHGVGEHCKRHSHLAERLAAEGFIVYGFDHQGHGRSEGERTLVGKFDDLTDDVEMIAHLAKQEVPEAPLFLLGHSMGGLVAIDALINKQETIGFKAAVLSGPALEPKASFVEKCLAYSVRTILPKLPTPKIKADLLSKNCQVVDGYRNDPLVCQLGPTFQLGAELLKKAAEIDKSKSASKICLPYLMMRGADDDICLKGGLERFHDLTQSKVKEYIELEGLRHEIFNEDGFEAVEKAVEFFKSQATTTTLTA